MPFVKYASLVKVVREAGYTGFQKKGPPYWWCVEHTLEAMTQEESEKLARYCLDLTPDLPEGITVAFDTVKENEKAIHFADLRCYHEGCKNLVYDAPKSKTERRRHVIQVIYPMSDGDSFFKHPECMAGRYGVQVAALLQQSDPDLAVDVSEGEGVARLYKKLQLAVPANLPEGARCPCMGLLSEPPMHLGIVWTMAKKDEPADEK